MDIADKSAKRDSFPVAQSKLSVSKTNEDENGEIELLNIRNQILHLHQQRGHRIDLDQLRNRVIRLAVFEYR